MFAKKPFNFVNVDIPCCKKSKECEKNLHLNCCYVAKFKKFVYYETTSKCQLSVTFHMKVFLVKLSIS